MISGETHGGEGHMRNTWVDKFLKDKQLGGLEKDFRKGVVVFLQEARKLPSYRNDQTLMGETTKEGTDFVTGADRLMQANLKKSLLQTDSYSGLKYGFWGEEAPDNTIEWQQYNRVWVSDPIEGTINYSGKRGNRDGDWGSVLSLVDTKTNEPLLGFIVDPIKRELVFAVKGNGAYKVNLDENWEDGKIESLVVNPKSPQEATVTFNRSPQFSADLKRQSEAFEEKIKGSVTNAIDPESGALEVVRYDGTVYFSTSNEMAAAMLVIEEAGGKAKDFDGNGWHPGIHTLIASYHPEIYEMLLSIIKQLR